MEQMKNCDQCGSEIIDNRCTCGQWYSSEQIPNFMKNIEQALLAYDHYCEQHNTEKPMSGAHYTGNCIILFKGDFAMSIKVKEFVKSISSSES